MLLVKSWLTHELDPKFICCSVQGRGAGEKGGRGGTNKKKREGRGREKERETLNSYNMMCLHLTKNSP